MALYQDLPVFADLYVLTHKVFLNTQDYPPGLSRLKIKDGPRFTGGEGLVS